MNNGNRICIFTTQFLPNIGGVENYCYNLAKTLTKMGNYCTIVTCNTHNLPEIETTEYATIFRLESINCLDGRYPIPRGSKRNKSIWTQLEKENIDYVVINTRFYLLSLHALKFSKKIGVKPIMIEHGSAHLTVGNFFIDLLVRFTEHGITWLDKRFPAEYYAVSKASGEWLNHFKITCNGFIYNAIDTNEFRGKTSGRDFRSELNLFPNTFLVVSIGRLVKEKGVLELASISKMLKGDIVILLAGDGPLYNKLREYESIHFHLLGPLARNDIAALLLQANILVLPSRSEGFATVLLEAAACYTPPITTNVGGAKEITHDGEYGIIIPQKSQNYLLKALCDAADFRSETAVLGQAIENHVTKHLSWEATAKALLAACKTAQNKD